MKKFSIHISSSLIEDIDSYTELEKPSLAEGLSRRNLTVFHYNQKLRPLDEGLESGGKDRETANIPYHTDVGILTVIPLSGGAGGRKELD